MARQRSRITWLREGDANTSYFQEQANHKRRKNFIGSISDGNRVVSSHEEIDEMFRNHFIGRFGSPAVRQGTLDLDFLGVNPADLSRLELPFKEEEIWEAIKEMPKEKAPGPDGYNITFYQRCWHIIKKDILEVFDCIHSRNCLAFDKVNGAHLVLLPKRPGAAVPNDIRPISLVHSLAKIVSKSWQEGWRLCSQASLAKIKGLF